MLSLRRKAFIISAAAFVLVACFTAGYFTVSGYLQLRNNGKQEWKNGKDNTVNASAGVHDIINSNTNLNIINRYIADGKTVYTENREEKAASDMIGMNKLQLEQYCRKNNSTVIEFNDSDVSLLKEIKGWPCGRYVVKSSNNKVAIYGVNDSNALEMEEETEITLDIIPDGDKEAITSGKIYETLDGAREYVEYSLGS